MSTIALPSDILQAWQHIEFFQPYTLEKRPSSILIRLAELIQNGDDSLPWHSSELRVEHGIPPKASYTVHIGIFEKNIASGISKKIFGDLNVDGEIECEQRLNLEGATCFAKLPLSFSGAPDMRKFSISSLPWALGLLEKRCFEKLDSATFKQDCQYLADQLELFSSTLKPVKENGPGVLRAIDILKLLENHLFPWAGFESESEFSLQYALQIDWSEIQGGHTEILQEEAYDTEDELSDGEKNLTLPILNSFYFEDIESAILALKKTPCRTLNKYLSQHSSRNPDLYSQEGMTSIINKLHPKKMPLGRWPSEPGNAMSLMQQFAINTSIDELSEGGILSVNGPPGTGKTTLLRDLIAHNIVERAIILSSFSHVEDTIDSDGFIVSKLTGFEMVIASSNNAAVENISKELPQITSLAEEFRFCDYLSPVANQMAARSRKKWEFKSGKNGEGKVRDYYLFRPLDEKEQCWGLISVALGKKSNRVKFAQRLRTDEHFLRKTCNEKDRPVDENFLSLWRWRFYYNAESFSSAKNKFNECLKETKKLQHELIAYADLLAVKPDNVLEELQKKLVCEQDLYDEIAGKVYLSETEKEFVEAQVNHVIQERKIIESESPGLLSRLFNRGKVRLHQQKVSKIRHEFLALSEELRHKINCVMNQREQLIEKELEVVRLHQQISLQKKLQAEYENNIALFQKQFSGIKIPDPECPINDAELQRVAFWQNTQINRQRSLLFIAAMELHQAWLYEALGKGRFSKKIYDLGSFMSHPHLDITPIRWWQTLSMFIPVFSTTFASVGRMFSGVKSEELGWLMIDEAGQASPQQAVGAICRAKRVLVVGDPLQIEPVFTTSTALVKHLCEDKLQQNATLWNPGMISVQQVADRTNPWGCELKVMNTTVWIGIPLWVHRRCIEPMFSLSNAMSYNSRMVHGLGTKKIYSQLINNVLENHWLVSKGGVGDKQYRDSHGRDLIKLLDRLLSEHIELQSIYIITPFKAVKNALLELLSQRDLRTWQQASPLLKKEDIDVWKKKGVGTVHTFQGKENDVVIMVLGCDEQDAGGAKWASSKPNLLNVALTRAKRNIFVIGDPNVWQTLPGFERVAKVLPEKYANEI